MAILHVTVWMLLVVLGLSTSQPFEEEQISKSSLQFNSKSSHIKQSAVNLSENQESNGQYHYHSWKSNSVTRVQSVHNHSVSQSHYYQIRRPYFTQFSGSPGRNPLDLVPQTFFYNTSRSSNNLPKRFPTFPYVPSSQPTTKSPGTNNTTTIKTVWNQISVSTTITTARPQLPYVPSSRSITKPPATNNATTIKTAWDQIPVSTTITTARPQLPYVPSSRSITKPPGTNNTTTIKTAWNQIPVSTTITTVRPTRRTRRPKQQSVTYPPLVHKETSPAPDSASKPTGTLGPTSEASPELQTSPPLTRPANELHLVTNRPSRSIIKTL